MSGGRVLVHFALECDDPEVDIGGESLWAMPLGDDLYRVENVPLFVPDLAFGDVITASRLDGIMEARAIVARSGHATLAVCFREGISPVALRVCLDELWRVGASGEGHERWIFSLDVSPEKDMDRVLDVLEAFRACGTLTWEFARRREPAGPVGVVEPEALARVAAFLQEDAREREAPKRAPEAGPQRDGGADGSPA